MCSKRNNVCSKRNGMCDKGKCGGRYIEIPLGVLKKKAKINVLEDTNYTVGHSLYYDYENNVLEERKNDGTR